VNNKVYKTKTTYTHTHMLNTHTNIHTLTQTEADTRYFMNIKQIKWKVYKINYAKRKIQKPAF